MDRVPIPLTPKWHKLKVYGVTVLVMKLEYLETRLIVYPYKIGPANLCVV